MKKVFCISYGRNTSVTKQGTCQACGGNAAVGHSDPKEQTK